MFINHIVARLGQFDSSMKWFRHIETTSSQSNILSEWKFTLAQCIFCCFSICHLLPTKPPSTHVGPKCHGCLGSYNEFEFSSWMIIVEKKKR